MHDPYFNVKIAFQSIFPSNNVAAMKEEAEKTISIVSLVIQPPKFLIEELDSYVRVRHD